MKLFARLRQMREFERAQMPFLKSIVDFDIVIEVGYAEEQGQPLTLKQLLLLNHSSRTTVRRRLEHLIRQGTVRRRKNVEDRRGPVPFGLSSSFQLLGKEHRILASHFLAAVNRPAPGLEE